MSADQTPLDEARPGQVWAAPGGQPMLFVRTEQRGGRPAPEHLFLATRDRIVLERWHPADEPFPERLELKYDPEATRRARELEWEVAILKAEREGLAAALKMAVGLVPPATATELRRHFAQTRDAQLGR